MALLVIMTLGMPKDTALADPPVELDCEAEKLRALSGVFDLLKVEYVVLKIISNKIEMLGASADLDDLTMAVNTGLAAALENARMVGSSLAEDELILACLSKAVGKEFTFQLQSAAAMDGVLSELAQGAVEGDPTLGTIPLSAYQNYLNRAIENKKDALDQGDDPITFRKFLPE